MFRDITINRVALLLSSIASILCILLVLYSKSFSDSLSMPVKLLIGLTIIIILFLIFRYVLKLVIFQKINLIYKIMSGVKKTDISFDENTPLDQLNTDVANWAFKTKEEINNLKSLADYRKEFVGNISHELKTPIFSIQGYLHTLVEGGIHDSSININYLQKALRNVERLEYIVDDLDTINHLETNKDAIQISTFDLRELVKKVLAELEKVANDTNIKLTYQKDDESPILVRGDIKRIHQVLYNLVINSIKYGRVHGETKISFHKMSDQYLVEVTDNGIGIKEKDLLHIFDRFYRVDQSGSRNLGGSGLGLSIVKHVLESHNQSITVNSKFGVGTSFNFTLDRN